MMPYVHPSGWSRVIKKYIAHPVIFPNIKFMCFWHALPNTTYAARSALKAVLRSVYADETRRMCYMESGVFIKSYIDICKNVSLICPDHSFIILLWCSIKFEAIIKHKSKIVWTTLSHWYTSGKLVGKLC